MFPGAATPLTMSVFGNATDWGMQAMHISFGVHPAGVYTPSQSKRHLVWFGSHFFLNLTRVLGPMCVNMLFAESLAKENGEMSLLGRINKECTYNDLLEANGPQMSLFTRACNGLRYVFTNFTAGWRLPRMLTRIDEAPSMLGLNAADNDNNDKDDAKSLFAKLEAYTRPGGPYSQQWADGIVCGATSAGSMLILMKLLCATKAEEWSTSRVALVGALLGCETDICVESADAASALDSLAHVIVTECTPEALSNFIEASHPDDALNWICTHNPLVNELFVQFLERHGHRCVKEAELRRLDWDQDPTPVLSLLQASIRSLIDKKGCEGSHNSEREQRDIDDILMNDPSLSHMNPITRQLSRWAIHRTRQSVARRELGKSLQIKLHSIVKRAFRKLGDLMEQEGYVPEGDADMMFFFTLSELKQLLNMRPGW